MKPLLVTLERDGRVLREIRTDALRGPLEIGRAATCAWSVAGIDPSMSSRHAELFSRRGAVFVRDLGSRNGITISGERVREKRLAAGDSFHLGSCTLRVERAPDADTSGTPAFNRLEQLNGADAGRVVDLPDSGESVIGSDVSCAVPCVDPLVSRKHAAVASKPDGSVWVRDLGSRNGTTVNSVPLPKDKERMLRDGDVLSVAYVEFRFSDKSVDHPRAHLLRKIGVAAATAAVALTGWYVWASVRPSSRVLLKTALDRAAVCAFDDAARAAAQAGDARGAEAYARRRREVLASIDAWRTTHRAWGRIRALVAARDWDGAQGESVNLRDWNWNSSDAPREGILAERALALLRSLRAAQRTLEENAAEARLAEAADSLGAARAAFAADSATPPDWAAPLVADSDAVLPELRETLRELAAVVAAADALAPGPGDELPAAAARAMETLDGILASNLARRAAAPAGGAVPASRAVEGRVGELRVPVGALCAAEGVFASNVAAVAAARFDELRRDLPLPSTQLLGIHVALPGYAAALRRRNETLCGAVSVGWKARLQTLRNDGLDAARAVRPPAIAELLSKRLAQEAVLFVPSPELPPAKAGADAPLEGCAYDRYVGIADFFDFVDSLDEDSDPTPAVSAYGGGGEGWAPVVARARVACAHLRAYRAYAEAHGEIGDLARLVLRAKPEGGTNVVAATLGFAGRVLVEVDLWGRRVFPGLCAEEGSGRAEILAAGVELLLSARPSRAKAAELAAKWREFKRSVPKWDGSDDSAAGIFRAALPGSGPHRTAWGHLHRKGAAAP